MFVKDMKGTWYDVKEYALKGKKVDAGRVRELIIMERADRCKKIDEIVKGLDIDELRILASKFTTQSGLPNVHGAVKLECSGQCPECQCPECQCPECQCPECVDPNWSGGNITHF